MSGTERALTGSVGTELEAMISELRDLEEDLKSCSLRSTGVSTWSTSGAEIVCNFM